MRATTASGLVLGVGLGRRPALEPDHLAAVSTLVTDPRGRFRGAILGALWGLGHTTSLFVVGFLLALLHADMPDRLADVFELGVAFMLIFLGVRALGRALRGGNQGAIAPHTHGGLRHEHHGPAAHVHVGTATLAIRPLVVGLIHGLAGSGALTAWVIAELPTTTARLVYIALFGIGSVFGMAILSGLVGWPLARFGRSPRVFRALSVVTGVVSMVFGVYWGIPLVERLMA